MECVNIFQSQKILPIVKLVTHERFEAITQGIYPVYPHEPGVHIRLRLLVSYEGLWEKIVSQMDFKEISIHLYASGSPGTHDEGVYSKP
jgi:hypothetical protein